MLDGTPPLTAFTAEFARLNTRQREAVEHPDGPVLVVAGPGTGKTQLLAARVAWLLRQPDARPQEILCLTYTEAAARNMRQRLLRFIGPDAHRVAIHTFHSFGQHIIQENADQLGYHGLTVASDLEMRQLFIDLIDALPAGHQLRRDSGDAYYEVKRLVPLFQNMKREGWSVSQLLLALEEYRVSLPDEKEYQYQNNMPARGIQAGDLKQHELAAEEDKIAKSGAAIELFHDYQRALRERGRYDYDDMLGWSIGLLRDHPHVLLGYQERYQHFLVDEYQDTNGAQSQLLHLLASYWDRPSVLVVGDDDQSIFRFQGASVANVLDFQIRYPTAHVVVLEENYRSSAAVLAAAEALIDRNQERLTKQVPGLSKHLVARHPQFAGSAVAAPVLRHFASPLHESAHVAAEVASLYQQGWPAGGGAVVVHDHAQLDTLALLLTAAGVPFYRKRQVNVLAEEALAVALYRVLNYLAAALLPNPAAAEPALFTLLHLDCLAIPPVDLVRLAAGYRLHHGRTAREKDSHAMPWREWMQQATTNKALAMELQLSSEGQAALGEALALLDTWLHAAASQPVPALFELICLKTLLPWHLSRHAQPDHLLAVARTLLQFGRAEARRRPDLSVASLLAVWELLAETLEGLPLEQTMGTEAAALQLLTAHGAKGLEFERVWVLGCQQAKWLKTYKPSRYRLPPSLVPAFSKQAEEEEGRRLFFVALTRAQEHLTLSFARTDDKGKESSECLFISDLVAALRVTATGVEVPEEVLAAALRQQLTPPAPPAPRPDAVLLDRLLADFALSATTLNAYLRCPIGCYYEQLLRVPGVRGEALHFGSAVHEALEHYFEQAQRHPEQLFGDGEALAAAFETRFARIRAELSPAAYERRRYAGQAQLRAYHARWHASWSPTAVVEHSVRLARTPGGTLLKGKLDRLDPRADGNGHDVLDYKTGNPTNATAKLKAAPHDPAAGLADWHRDERLRGGDYWRQAVFYHLLLSHDTEHRFRPASVSFDFIQAEEKPGQVPEFVHKRVVIGPDDEATVLAQIQAVDAAIRAHQFDHGCGECAWCQLRTA